MKSHYGYHLYMGQYLLPVVLIEVVAFIIIFWDVNV